MTEKEIVELQRLVDSITSFVNGFSVQEDKFVEIMASEHRTLQQSFTKLVFKWLEFVASDNYRYDDRNRASHDIAREMISAFSWVKTRSQDDTVNPSDYLPLI